MARKEGVILKHDRSTGLLTIEDSKGNAGLKVLAKQVVGVSYESLYMDSKDNIYDVELITTGGLFSLRNEYSKEDIDKILNFISNATSANHTGDMCTELFIEN